MLDDPWKVSEGEFPKSGDAEEKLHFLLNYAVLAPLGAQYAAMAFQGKG